MRWFRTMLYGNPDPKKHGRPIYLGGPIFHRFVLGYLILAVGCVLGLWLSYSANQGTHHASVSADRAIRSTIRQRVEQQRKINHAVCLALNNENRLIVQSLSRSQQNIPKLAYYRQHPAELREALAEIKRQLADFKPRTC